MLIPQPGASAFFYVKKILKKPVFLSDKATSYVVRKDLKSKNSTDKNVFSLLDFFTKYGIAPLQSKGGLPMI